MTEVAVPKMQMPVLDLSKVPAAINTIIDVKAWASAILTGTEYVEPDPDFVSRTITYKILTAATMEDAFAQAKVGKLQQSIANLPGATTGPIEITDLYVATSDFETGNPSYVIITATDLETGEEWKRTTGATNVQGMLLAFMIHGVWPIRCQIKRGDSKDKGGRYLLFVLPPD